MNKNLTIIYMGTPEFAVAPLRAISEAGYNVPVVVTSPDKPAGRGRKTQSSQVKLFAMEMGLQVLQPFNLKDPVFISQLKSYGADIQVVVAFRMLPEQVWSMPPKGTINLHASLLPQYRGAAPINHAIMNGEKRTGVTTFFINKDIDTGQIIMQKEVEIPDAFTAGDLHDELMKSGARLVVETLALIEKGNFNPIPQSDLIKHDQILKPAPKIFRDDCRINWNADVLKIYNMIRGLSPSPSAFAYLSGQSETMMIKFFRAGYKSGTHHFSPGTIVIENRSRFLIAVPGGFIIPQEIQPADRKRMDANSFMNGIRDFDKFHFE
jgi:methionyl-tRNA formyltransferase